MVRKEAFTSIFGDWPPTFDELSSIVPDTAYSAYSKKIYDLLDTNERTKCCDDYDKKLLGMAVVRLDTFASASISNLTFPLEQLAFVMPPETTVGNERELKRWRADRAHFQCVEAAYRARQAILAGNFVEAIVKALDAGHFSRFALAEIGFEREQIRRKAGRANKEKAGKHLDTIIGEARAIVAREKSKGKKYNITSIAAETAAYHENEPGFPGLDAIRRALGKNRESWESR